MSQVFQHIKATILIRSPTFNDLCCSWRNQPLLLGWSTMPRGAQVGKSGAKSFVADSGCSIPVLKENLSVILPEKSEIFFFSHVVMKAEFPAQCFHGIEVGQLNTSRQNSCIWQFVCVFPFCFETQTRFQNVRIFWGAEFWSVLKQRASVAGCVLGVLQDYPWDSVPLLELWELCSVLRQLLSCKCSQAVFSWKNHPQKSISI